MHLQLGRTIDHLQLRVADLDATRRFYTAVLEALGRELIAEPGHLRIDELHISDNGPVTANLHLAFQAADHEAVQRFHAAGLAAGGTDNGGPGERDYRPGYYAAFVLDPDGNNIEAVAFPVVARSAPSIDVELPGDQRP